MNAFKQQCIELRKRDYTLADIVAVTGRPKTSVYAHVRHLPLSVQKQEDITRARKCRAKELAGARKGRSKRSFIPITYWDKSSVRLLAHLLFDGEIQKGRCVYSNRNKVLIDRVVRSMQIVYIYAPTQYLNEVTGVQRVSYHNVALAAHLQQKSRELLRDIATLSLPLQRTFLQAFFDDEGCVEYRPRYRTRRVRGYQRNVHLLTLVQMLLARSGIKARSGGKYEIVIGDRANLVRFQQDINFSPGVCLHGDRANSVWGCTLEKREVLARAIASFKSADQAQMRLRR